MSLYVIGVGHAFPEGRITNDALKENGISVSSDNSSLDFVAERATTLPLFYITETKNIDTWVARSVAQQNASDLGAQAARLALERAGLTSENIGLILGDCNTPIETTPGEAQRIIAEQRGFCAAVVSNCSWKPWKSSRPRGKLMRKLHQAQGIASGGRFMNTIGRVIPFGYDQKENFIKQYKFCVAFENKIMDGYTTEKLTQAMWMRCIPLYWGNRRVQLDFNPKSFINRHEFPDDESFIRHILEVDRDPDLYMEYLEQPFFYDNTPNRYYDDNYLREFLEKVIGDTTRPISHRQKFWHLGRWRLAKQMHAN